jgi:hypothetical protein
MNQHNDMHDRLWMLARGEEDAELSAHVAGCSVCQEELATLRILVQHRAVTGSGLVEPPQSLLADATALFRRIRPDLLPAPSRPARSEALDRLRQITARLVIDTALTPQLNGLRGGSNHRTRQIAFVSDAADLDLELSPTDPKTRRASVVGQLGMDTVPIGLSIRFSTIQRAPSQTHSAALTAIETDISTDGYFNLSLPVGEWHASVQIDDAVVLFPGIRV